MVGVGGMGGLNPVDLSKMLSGKIAQAQPSIGEYTHGVSGSATPKDLETALQLSYLAQTAPNMTPEVFELLKRRLAGALENRAQNPRAVFGERVGQVNSSNHYSATELTPADVPALNLETMRRFYNARFANAADQTYFFVGAFTVDEITPLIEKWIGSLPSTGKRSSAARDMGVRFPTAVVKEEVKKGKEPASQTVLTFFADPGFDEFEMHRARAASSVLNIRLREILREEMGGTYGVGVGFSNTPPREGLRHHGGAVRQRAGERRQDGRRHAEGNRAAQDRRAVARRCQQGQGARTPRPRDQYASRTPTGWARCRPCTCTAGIRPASPAASIAPRS